jgi:hypothetical protein
VAKLSLAEYLAPRKNAQKAKAPERVAELYVQAELQFVKATQKVENGDVKGGLKEAAPYLVESRLREFGAVIEAGPAWTSKVVVDGNLITGQNPQSSVDTAQEVIKALEARRL